MYNFTKLILMMLFVFVLSTINNKSYAVTAEAVKECGTDTHLFTGSATACRFTPQLYKAAVFEMGLCTANPMSGASLDRSTCTTVFTATDQTNGSLHDFALGDVELIGTSTRPANGTYTFPYIILKNTFTIKAEYERGGTTYYVKKSGSACDAVSTTSPAEECTDSLTQFNQAGNCDGEYLGARFSGGSLNGYLMRASDLDKRDGAADDDGSGGCSNVDRLVGVMELDTPVVISPSTISFKFTFNVTGYGAQMFTGAGRPNNNPNGGGGSGPFSGFFTIVDAPQQ
jgi:hypothetical protein